MSQNTRATISEMFGEIEEFVDELLQTRYKALDLIIEREARGKFPCLMIRLNSRRSRRTVAHTEVHRASELRKGRFVSRA